MSHDSVSLLDDDDESCQAPTRTSKTSLQDIADAVLILPCDLQVIEPTLTPPAAQLCELLSSSGFTVEVYSSLVKRQFLYVTLRIRPSLLESYAGTCEDVKFHMNPYALRAVYDYGDMASTELNDSLEYIFQPYSAKLAELKLYKHDVAGGTGIFQAPIRLAIVEHILYNKFCLESLQQSGVVIECYPPHDVKQVQVLSSDFLYPWSACMFRPRHLTAFKDYFGKEFAYYLVFLGHLVKMMTLPLLLAVWGVCTQSQGLPAVLQGLVLPYLFFATLQSWERKVVVCATEWGSHLPTKSTATRKCVDASPWQLLVNPKFHSGLPNQSLLWPLQLVYIAPRSQFAQLLRLGQSVLVSLFLLFFCVFVLLLIMLIMKSVFAGLGFNSSFMLLVVPVILFALLALFLTRPFDGVCECLTSLENHRTKIGYHRALLVKQICWRLCVFPSPAFYIAFLQENLETNCGFSPCSTSAGIAALIVFTAISASDMFTVYMVPRIQKARAIQFLARHQSSLQSLMTLATNPIASSINADLQAAGTSDKNPNSSGENPVASRVSTATEHEFLTFQKPSRPDRDWDDRSSHAAHYDMQLNAVIKLFLVVCFGGISPAIIILAVGFACLEIGLVISGSLYVRRRSFGPYNGYPGINDNIITALKVVAWMSAFIVPILYVTVTHGPIFSVIGHFDDVHKILSVCMYTWVTLLFNKALQTFYPIVPDKIKLVQAKQRFFDEDLKNRLTLSKAAAQHSATYSHSNYSVSHFEEGNRLAAPDSGYFDRSRLALNKNGSRARDWQDIESMQGVPTPTRVS